MLNSNLGKGERIIEIIQWWVLRIQLYFLVKNEDCLSIHVEIRAVFVNIFKYEKYFYS